MGLHAARESWAGSALNVWDGQRAQSVTFFAPVALLYLPGGHGEVSPPSLVWPRPVNDPERQKYPASHLSVQGSRRLPSALPYMPATHGVQGASDLPVSSHRPGKQRLHAIAVCWPMRPRVAVLLLQLAASVVIPFLDVHHSGHVTAAFPGSPFIPKNMTLHIIAIPLLQL